ncbi:MAG: hypothetical protein KDA25_09980, partial [Phycisphaerales bacterium]|nr:hypothetical protein [Phycisphaerales bacterium]
MLREQHRFFRSVWMCCDVVVLVAAVVLAYWTRYHFMAHNDPSPHFRTHAIPILAYVPIMILAMIWSKLYVARRDQRFVFECGAIIRAVVIGMGVTVVIVTMLRNVLFGPMDYSRVQ